MDDSKITEVYRKPMNCPICKGKFVEILYGEPTEFAMQLVDEKKLVLGGCCMTEESPKWECVECEMRFLKKNVLKDSLN